MSLFRDENPALGPTTQVKELSGYGAGTPVVSYFKPSTREFASYTNLVAASPTSNYLWVAPWACQIVGVHFNCLTAASAGVLSVEKITADSVAPAAANGTTIVLLTAATATLSGFAANTRQTLALSAVSGAVTLAAGDQLAYFLSTAATSLVGGILQVEIAQIG